MKLLIDMNLSPTLVPLFQSGGHEAEHWSRAGAFDAPDIEIMAYAAARGQVVVTNDYDFGTHLALSRAHQPSVIQVRADDLRALVIAPLILNVLGRFQEELIAGAFIAVYTARNKVRLLPL